MISECNLVDDALGTWPEPIGYVARTDRSCIGNVNVGANWLSRITPNSYSYYFLDECLQVAEQGYLQEAISRSLFTSSQLADTVIYPVYGKIRETGYLALSPDGTEAGVPAELRAEMAYRAECERQYRSRRSNTIDGQRVYVNLQEAEASVLKALLQWTAT